MYLKDLSITIPEGYTPQAITSNSNKIYIAANHATNPKLLVYNQAGVRQTDDEFSIRRLATGEKYDGITIDALNIYICVTSKSLLRLGVVYPYSLNGSANQDIILENLTGVPDTTLRSVRGLTFSQGAESGSAGSFRRVQNTLIVNTGGNNVNTGLGRYSLSGLYFDDSFISLTDNITSIVETDRYIYGLTANKLLAYDRAFQRISEEDVTLHSTNPNPVGVAYNGNALIVFDTSNKLFFYGSEQPAAIPVITSTKAQWRGKGHKRLEIALDLIRIESDRDLRVIAANVKGIRQDVALQDAERLSLDVSGETVNSQILLKYPILSLQNGDYIALSRGGTPTTLPPNERYKILSIAESGDGARSKQILYCIKE